MYRSTSYSDDMNYGYGRNVTVAYTLDPFTSEDAAIASKSLSKDFSVVEVEEITIPLNSNDFLLNLYGDKKHYVPLPKIGQRVSSVIAASRRQFNNQLLFDFKTSALMSIHEGEDNVFYCDNDVEVVDYTIYDNNEERIGNSFYTQINELIDAQESYYSEILKECEKIRNSGADYTREVDYEYKRATDFFDKKKKWREGDSNFGNIEIKIKIKRVSPLAKGCKLSGRCGNKSVISEIWDDDKMPYTKDGRRVDLLLNLLAIINRTTAWVLFEIFINGCSYQVRQKMKELPFKEQEEMLFDYVRVWNEKQAALLYNNHKKLSKKEKEKYIEDAIYDGIYINQNSMWESTPVFYRCMNVRKKFPFIQMNDLYIQKWGKEQKILDKYFIGEMYCIRLKQSDRRGFSARSTGALDNKSLPTRSFKSKSHQERISSSCIRFGEFESLNFSIGLLPVDITLFHALYRTSIKGRKALIELMFSDPDDVAAIDKLDPTYTSRVVEIFNVILKSLGVEMEFTDDDESVKILNDDTISSHSLNGKTYFCTDYQFFLIKRMDIIRKEIQEKNPIITKSRLMKMIKDEMVKKNYVDSRLTKDLMGIEFMLPDDEINEELAEELDKTNTEAEEVKEEVEEILTKPVKRRRKKAEVTC